MSVKSICMAGSFESKGEMFVGEGGGWVFVRIVG